MDFDEDDLGNSQDSQQFRQGYFIHTFIYTIQINSQNKFVEQKLRNYVIMYFFFNTLHYENKFINTFRPTDILHIFTKF